jgi:hypothetical protein
MNPSYVREGKDEEGSEPGIRDCCLLARIKSREYQTFHLLRSLFIFSPVPLITILTL